MPDTPSADDGYWLSRSGSAERRRQTVAKLVTELTAPVVSVSIATLILSLKTETALLNAITVWIIAAGFSAWLPMSYVFYGLRSGRITDHHVSKRSERVVPAIIAIISSCVGYWLLHLLAASPLVLRLYLTGIVLLITVAAITLRWKISAHVTVFCGAVTATATAINGRILVLLIAAPLIAWARVSLGDHTLLQVGVGALVGIALPLAIYRF
jgi:hypothetical protein